MNWVDAVLIVLLLASVIVGSKKGLIRELTAFIVFFAAIIISVRFIDDFAVLVYEKVGGSPLISAFLSFAMLLAGTYAAFKVLGLLFYKFADIKGAKKRDQMGGALVGFLRGWAAIGFLTFVVFLLPMPDRFYVDFEDSFFGPTVAKTVPLMFESTAMLHPRRPNFMDQIENALVLSPTTGPDMESEDRAEIFRVLYQIDRFFNLNPTPGS
jgi:membrane protein required for colicin V production